LDVSARCRELFDIEALLKALTAELNSFNADSLVDSLPQQFLRWVSVSLTQKHVVFDAGACMSVDVEEPLVVAILEVLFIGQPLAEAEDMYRGSFLKDLFILPGSNPGDSKMGCAEDQDGDRGAPDDMSDAVRRKASKKAGSKGKRAKKGGR